MNGLQLFILLYLIGNGRPQSPQLNCPIPLDLMYLINDSQDVDATEFSLLIKFLQDLSDQLDVDSGSVHIAAITFNNRATVEFDLNDHLTNADVNTALDAIPNEMAGASNFATVLNVAGDFFGPPSDPSVRVGATQVVMIIIDGNGYQSAAIQAAIPAANNLKFEGVTIIAVSIGDEILESHLQQIATNSSLVFLPDNYDDLSLFIDSISQELIETCPPTSSPSLSPSIAPSLTPSSSPTQAPSFSPSIAPSSTPTQPPSLAPSINPTQQPSISPSLVPTQVPSLNPSIAPSLFPSVAPTQPPSISPSFIPSIAPSFIPSIAPSNTPTQPPSLYPSLNPSSSPSNTPTQPPSSSPSFIPTQQPFLNPSSAVSNGPSLSPVLLFAITNATIDTEQDIIDNSAEESNLNSKDESDDIESNEIFNLESEQDESNENQESGNDVFYISESIEFESYRDSLDIDSSTNSNKIHNEESSTESDKKKNKKHQRMPTLRPIINIPIV
eukprot:69161_1